VSPRRAGYDAGVNLLRSTLLAAFPHGFTTRAGGVSAPPFDALNLGGAVDDDPAAVEQNWARLVAATRLSFARVRQVHGDRITLVSAGGRPGEEADGVATRAPGVAACVLVADCAPVLLGDLRTGAVAAVHAGWRGTIARIAARGVEALVRDLGARPSDLVAAVGPSIGPCCYEVSPELAARFADELGDDVVTGEAARPRLDLWRANARALHDAGVPASRVDVLGRCTSCAPELFFSHRRDRGHTGRQVGFIAPLPTAVP
jgi:polyphenol oxidase